MPSPPVDRPPPCFPVSTSATAGAAKLEAEAVPGFQRQAQVVLGFRPFNRFRLRVEKVILLSEAVAQRGLAMGQRFAVEMVLAQPEAAFQYIPFEVAAGVNGRAEGNPVLADAGVRFWRP